MGEFGGKVGDFQELGHHPLFDLSGGPWNCLGPCESESVRCSVGSDSLRPRGLL